MELKPGYRVSFWIDGEVDRADVFPSRFSTASIGELEHPSGLDCKGYEEFIQAEASKQGLIAVRSPHHAGCSFILVSPCDKIWRA
jgi:hypothetical protein